ncbi:glycosyltransferase family 2 protein [Tianweitania sp. Rool2]|uniref:Glycosyltransferase family 2 protein n=1 Tax=Oryzicola mucosus TaxID=2767425 RepID=A0A8J6PU47_9HYPH|nr:glycosyltransferase family 2 protein [Oryzicola mucosus]
MIVNTSEASAALLLHDAKVISLSERVPASFSPFAVVVVTYNSAAVLEGLLDSLPSGLAGAGDFTVYIVDNDSHDESVRIAEAHSVRPVVIRMGRNAGYAAGINAALARLDPLADVLILNPDIRLHPGVGRELRCRLQDRAIGVVVPKIMNDDGSLNRSLRRQPSVVTAWSDALFGSKVAARFNLGEVVADAAVYDRGGAAEWATGAILMIAGHARQLVGDWDESFFLYSEEVDYLERIRHSGLSVFYEPRAKAVHIGGDYQDNAFLSALMTRNRIRYHRRHHGALATALFRLSIIVGETMRFTLGPGHRAALRAAIGPIEWSGVEGPASTRDLAV